MVPINASLVSGLDEPLINDLSEVTPEDIFYASRDSKGRMKLAKEYVENNYRERLTALYGNYHSLSLFRKIGDPEGRNLLNRAKWIEIYCSEEIFAARSPIQYLVVKIFKVISTITGTMCMPLWWLVCDENSQIMTKKCIKALKASSGIVLIAIAMECFPLMVPGACLLTIHWTWEMIENTICNMI